MDWVGHADLIESPDGKYYGVFLAARPNKKDRVNTGRETFILPVDWSGEFPVFEGGLEPLSIKQKMPEDVENETGKNGFFPNGNFTFTDKFSSKKPDYRWIGVRGPRENFVTIVEGGLQITPFATNIKAQAPTSALFYRQQHNSFTASTTLRYVPQSEKELAGIVCYQKETYNYVFGITKKGDNFYAVLQRTEDGNSTIIASEKISYKAGQGVQLQVKASGDEYAFSYAVGGKKLKNVGGVASGDILSTNIAGGFTGSLIGLYATSDNDAQPATKTK